MPRPQTGEHRIIAQIAFLEMTEAERLRVTAVLAYDRFAKVVDDSGSSSRYDAGYTVDPPTLSYSSDSTAYSAGYSPNSGADTALPAAYTLDTGADRYSTESSYGSDSYNGLALGVPAYDEFYNALS